MATKYLDFYRKHHQNTQYGTTGRNKAKDVLAAISNRGVRSVLDWGAGSQTLGQILQQMRPDIRVFNYDPAVPEISKLPGHSFCAVVSTDVLEHIPYDEIDDALAQIVSLTDKIGFHHIATSPAQLILPDGQNAHLIQEPAAWWADRFQRQGVRIISAVDTGKPDGRQYTAAKITFDKEP